MTGVKKSNKNAFNNSIQSWALFNQSQNDSPAYFLQF